MKKSDRTTLDLIKGGGATLFFKVFGMLLSYLSMFFITNVYGAEEWGLFTLCLTIINILILIPKFGFDNALVRIAVELINNKDYEGLKHVILKAIVVSILIGLLVISLVYAFSDTLIQDVLKEEKLKNQIVIILLSVIPLVFVHIFAAIFQAYKKVVLFITSKVTLINLSFLIILTLSYYLNFKIGIIEAYFYAIIISLSVSSIFLFKIFKKSSKHIQVDKKSDDYNLKQILKVSLPMLFAGSLGLLMGWSDILMLSYFRPIEEVGIYNSALKLAMLSMISLSAVNAITTPKIVNFYTKNDKEGLKKLIQKSTKLIFITTAPFLLVLSLFPKFFLGILGEEFSVGYLALIYLCISRFINAISGSVGYIMQMTDQQKTYQNVILIAFFINLVLNFILIPIYGFTGAAIASSIAMIFWNITLVVIVRKKLGFWTIYIPFFNR